MASLIKEYCNEAKRIQDKYFKIGELTSKEFFDYYWSKSQVALIKSLDEQNPKIKERLERKWERAFAQPITASVQRVYQDLADSIQKMINSTERLLESKKKSNESLYRSVFRIEDLKNSIDLRAVV